MVQLLLGLPGSAPVAKDFQVVRAIQATVAALDAAPFDLVFGGGTAMLCGGKHAARKLKRAQILLSADSGMSDAVIAASICVGESTVYRTKRRFVEGNLGLALSEEPRPGSERKLSGKEEALLIATACSSPPEGRARWTLESLAGEMVKRTEHAELSGVGSRCV